MAEPIANLIYVALTILIIGFIFWPESGLLWKLKRSLRNTQRVRIEDALKHLYDQEYKALTCTLQSISGSLSISGEKTANLMTRLEGLGLVKSHGDGFDLTPEGRSYALRMIRIHRLWERYLADETGLAETEWHRKAEKLEHHMTDNEIDALDDSVGHPTYDPHGDPIPTPSGKLPPKKGQALTDLAVDELAQVIHIEDQPGAIYAQLVAERLHLGTQIRILQKSPERLTFIADGEEIVLAPVVAANVTVEPLPVDDEMEGPHERLAALTMGDRAEVVAVSKGCRGLQRRRIMDLGVIPGTIITAELRSASGDPTAYNIRGATIALRKNQAEMIHIRRIQEAA